MIPRTPPSALLLAAVATLAGGKVCAAAPPDGAAFQSVPELEAGFLLLYGQKFSEGRQIFLAWESKHPEEPFAHIAVAASFLFEEFYAQGVLSSEFFMNAKKFLRGIARKPDAKRMAGFRREREHAIATARAPKQGPERCGSPVCIDPRSGDPGGRTEHTGKKEPGEPEADQGSGRGRQAPACRAAGCRRNSVPSLKLGRRRAKSHWLRNRYRWASGG